MPGVFSFIPLLNNLNQVLSPIKEEFILNLKAYIFSFIIDKTIINIRIIFCFNPKQGLKVAAACIGCLGGAAGVGVLSKLHRFCLRSGNRGLLNPDLVVPCKTCSGIFGKRLFPTARGVLQGKVYTEVFSRPFPTYPGTDMVHSEDVGRVLAEEGTPLQRKRD